jgi:hypothetical protein
MSTIDELTTPREPLTRSEYKKMMSQMWTVRRDIVDACGHLFYPEEQPKNNCLFCWYAFFQIHGEVVQTADECFQKEGREMLTRIRGEKFVKNFIKFMATVERMKELKTEELGENGDISGEV